MSEKIKSAEPAKTNKLRTRAAAAVLAVGLLGGAAATEATEKLSQGDEYAVNHEVSAGTVSEAAELQIANALASDHYLPVAEDVTAVVSYADGSHINIENPIIEKVLTAGDYEEGDRSNYHVAVAERTRGSDAGELSVVTAYSAGERDVVDIRFHGQDLYQEGESDIDNVTLTPMPLDRAPGLSNEGTGNYFIVTPSEGDQSHSSELAVAQGTMYVNEYAEAGGK